MTQPLISVIVPVHDVAEHLTACLHSLRAQTWESFEVIVVDDGSTDGSEAIARQQAEEDRRLAVITQTNAGLGAARNTGLAHAKGAFIAFVDSDDRVMPDYLARLHAELERTGADWVACGLCNVHPDDTGSTHSGRHGTPELAAKDVSTYNRFSSWLDVIDHFPSAWNKLYRRHLIEGLTFDEGTWFEDHGFFLRAAARTDHIVHLPQALYLQTRGRPGQITAADDDRVMQQFSVLERAREILQAGPHGDADQAFAMLAARLVAERARALRNPLRRTQFAQAVVDWYAQQGLVYKPATGDGQAWGLEIAGKLPLSIVIGWDGRDRAALDATLNALAAQDAIGHEIILAGPGRAVPDNPPVPLRYVVAGSDAVAKGIAQARGELVSILFPGDCPVPSGLPSLVALMLENGADMGFSMFAQGPEAEHVDGFIAPCLLPYRPPATGVITVPPELAVAIDLRPAGKIFRRAFLLETGVMPASGPAGARSLILAAAVLAEKVVYLSATTVHCPRAKPGGTSGHRTLVRAMPRCAHARLPDGWQRRIFARALREELDNASGSVARIRTATAGMMRAFLHGLSGARTRLAGLDETIGPGMARLLNPAALIGGGSLATPGDKWPEPPTALISAKHRAALRLRVNFDENNHANMSLMGRGAHPTPLHISLRFGEGFLVINDRRSDGRWRAERIHQCPLPRSGCDLVIIVEKRRARILIDGETRAIMKPRRPWRRSGIRGLSKIETLALEGGIRLIEAQGAPPSRKLGFDTRLQLTTALPRGTDANAYVLEVEVAPGATHKLELTEQTIQGAPSALVATLPGRFWQSVPKDGAMILRLRGSKGRSSRRMRLTRTGMAEVLLTFLLRDPPKSDTTPILIALEHLREPGIWEALPLRAQSQARKLAGFYRLAETLPPGPPPPPLSQDTSHAAIDVAVARISDSQRAAWGMDSNPREPVSTDMRPDALDVFDMLFVPSQTIRAGTFLALSEMFCHADQDTAGFVARCNAMPAVPGNDPWTDSALLPFLLLSEAPERAIPVLEGLVTAEGWVLTPPVAFTLRHAVDALSGDTRDRLVRAAIAFIEAQSMQPWGRAHCRELTDAAAHLLKTELPGYLTGAVEDFCLRIYGLSPRFWAELDATALSLRMEHARRTFTELETARAAEDGKGIRQALRIFEDLRCVEVPKVRRGLFGPAGIALSGEEEVTPSMLCDAQLDPHQAVIRHYAFPGAGAVPEAFLPLAAEALRVLHNGITRAPLPCLQTRLAEAAEIVMETPSEVNQNRLWQTAWPLMTEESGWLGVGIVLAVIAQHPEETDVLVARMASLPSGRQAEFLGATAPRIAARRLSPPLRDRLLPNLIPVDPTGPRTDGSGLYDALVVVFSCQPYLDTRIAALREGWLKLLAPIGVPYIVVVGGGDGRNEGDVVYLDAPDDYEGLPRKTLAAIEWVRTHSDAGHMIKIDDDCFLNAPLFFRTLSWRAHACLGRKLSRLPGQTDRIWHQAKSRSPVGRHDYDRSPEPSSYPDGGSGYALSREAMAEIGRIKETSAGKRLIEASFMEDKMLGDLLALAGITPSSQDFSVTVRRRSHPDALPVGVWQNGFLPSRAAPVMLAHLDTHNDQGAALANLSAPVLMPPKIWPTAQNAQLGEQSNALELISPPERLDRASTAPVAVVACMRNEMAMLPHFLSHYRRLGIESFLVADNLSDDGTLEYLVAQPDVAVFSVDTDYNRSEYGVAWQQALLAAYRQNRWAVVADADELLFWQTPQQATLPDLLANPDFAHIDAVRIFMLDMYPEGPLSEATFASGDPFSEAGFADRVPFLTASPMRGPFSDQPAWTSALRHRLIRGSRPNLFTAQKIALLRYHPFMQLSAGLHFVGGAKLAKRDLFFGHFKYTAAFRAKAITEVARGQHWGGAVEYQRYLALMSEGRDRIFDATLSVPWHAVPFVKARLEPALEPTL